MTLQGGGGGGCSYTQEEEKKKKSKAEIILDTVLKVLTDYCGKSSDWYKDIEKNCRKKLSDLAEGTGERLSALVTEVDAIA